MKITGAILFNLLLFAQSNCIGAQDWKKIVPLKTTRAEVETTFGRATGAFEVLYQLKAGRLSIEYSSGPCRPDRKGGWNVLENVVVSVYFSPKRPKRVSEIKLDPTKFRKVIDDHVLGAIYYINDEEGITYAVQQGKVDYVEYGPPKKYDYLYCKDHPAGEVRRAPKKP